MKKRHNKVVFKPYIMDQPSLLPPSLEELIPEGHIVRVVNEVVDQLDASPMMREYKGGGTSSYHPVMMLKVLIYAYIERVFSSRRIAKALRENINFMWLSGSNRPDFRTINRFRGKILKNVITEMFTEVLEYLSDHGYVKLEDYFLDGTKIEANANRYSYVWRKSTENYKHKIKEKVCEMMKEIDRIELEDEKRYGEKDLEELGEEADINSEDLKELVERLNEKLKADSEDKQLKKAVKKLEKNYIPRMKKYERYEKILGRRNSFSKTDPDATFMGMKEDHMQNKQLKPGYNVQIGTEDQFIVGYSLHQRPGDSPCLIPHLEKIYAKLGKYPKKVTGDAGYGSEENYAYLEERGIKAYVKYNHFDREQSKHRKIPEREIYWSSNWEYDEQKDEFICPQNKHLTYKKTRQSKSENEYTSNRRIYRCKDCADCPVKEKCTKSKDGRSVSMSLPLRHFRQQASDRLCSPKGKKLRSKRLIEAEAVFGRLKHNWGFRRFLTRGLEMVNTEWGLLSIAHDITKVAV